VPELPLKDLKVIDFTTLLPGPFATLLLAEAGAEVIKVEPPEGEGMRRSGPKWDGHSALFALLNAGKSSLALDLKDPDDLARLMPLIEEADVLVEQFRPGVMARFGLDYSTLKTRNPGLIYCSISGYGQTGPLAGRAGHDLNYMGECGVLALNAGPAGAPQLPPLLGADIAGGAQPAVMNILLSLMQRQRTGEGGHIDVAMSENMLPFAFWALPEGELAGHWPRHASHLFSGGRARYQLYTAKDGGLIAVAALEEKFWQIFCEAIELPEDLRDDRIDPGASIAAVQDAIAAHATVHWERLFARIDCCCSVVKTLEEAVQSEHFRARQVFERTLDGHQPLHALPLPLSPGLRRPVDQVLRPPELGERNSTPSFSRRS
jgi:crotonobetainyl-CoA:carnitine CoA-transferase CaiB-like acyl-CoA transferase